MNAVTSAEMSALQDTGYMPSESDTIRRIFKGLMDSGTIKLGQLLLDLGAGEGVVLIEAARLGLHSYGIEINSNVFVEGARHIVDARLTYLPADVACEIAQGSYFLKEYMKLREQGSAIAPKYEDGEFCFDRKGSKTYPMEKRATKLFPVLSDPYPYDTLEMDFLDFDVFFSYTWGIELPAQLEMFSKFARDGAVFLNRNAVDVQDQKGLLTELGLSSKDIGMGSGYFYTTVYRKAGK